MKKVELVREECVGAGMVNKETTLEQLRALALNSPYLGLIRGVSNGGRICVAGCTALSSSGNNDKNIPAGSCVDEVNSRKKIGERNFLQCPFARIDNN